MRIKKTAVLLFGLLLAFSTMSQNRVDFGFRGGISTSQVSTDLSDYTSDKITGYQGGAFLRIFFTKHIVFEPEAYFTKKGGELFNNDNGNENQISFEINSIDVPLLLGIKFFDLDFTRLLIYTGPVMSFAHDKSVEFIENGDEDFQKSASHLLESTNWSYQLGGSLDILIFTLDLRYEWGLNDIYEGDNQFRENAFLIGLGIRIF
jgi:hypothetical protein